MASEPASRAAPTGRKGALILLLFVVTTEALISPVAVSKPVPGGHLHRLHEVRHPVIAGPTSTPGGYNQTYGYPDGIGGLIVEGPGPATDFPLWSDANRWGAYGMIIAPGTFQKKGSSACSPVPAGSPFAGQQPVKMTNGVNDCLIGCNASEVKRTGMDPCHAGSLGEAGLSNSPMSCFDLGPGTVAGGGACGYNCSLLVGGAGRALSELSGPIPCSKADHDAGKCFIYCDSRTFPGL